MNKNTLILLCLGTVLVWATWFFRYAPTETGFVLDRLMGKYVLLDIDTDSVKSSQ